MDDAEYSEKIVTKEILGSVNSQQGSSSIDAARALNLTSVPYGWYSQNIVRPCLVTGVRNVSTYVNEIDLVNVFRIPSTGTNRLAVDVQCNTISMTSPTAVSVGIASAALIVANSSRRYLSISNTSAAARISIAFGVAAVLDSGITIQPGQTWEMSELKGNVNRGEVRAIASAAATNAGLQEGI